MIKKFGIGLMFICAFMVITAAFAQKVEKLEEIVVTATRTEESLDRIGSAVTVITAEHIRQQKANTVLDVLRSLPGVHIARTGTLGKTTSVFLRGGNSDHALVMLDGVQMNSPTLGSFEWTNVTTDNIDRIEIVRGPQSTLYGSDALSGVINIITRNGAGKPQMRFEARGSSHSVFTERASLGGAMDKLRYSIEASRTDSAGLDSVDVPLYKATAGGKDALIDLYRAQDYGNDRYHNTTLSGRAMYPLSGKLALDFVGRFYRGDGGIPGQLTLDADGKIAKNFDQNAHQIITTGVGLLRLNADVIDGMQSRLNLSIGVDSAEFEDLKDPGQERAFEAHSKIDTSILTADWQNTVQLNRYFTLGQQFQNTLVFGAEVEGQNAKNLDRLAESDVFDESVTNLAFYAQESLDGSSHFFITAGGRFDHHSKFGSVFNPRVTTAYLLRETDTKFHASFGTGFRAPTFNDLFYPGYGNLNLKPEESASFDVGIEQRLFKGSVSAGVTYFQNAFNNLIAAELIDPENFVYQAANIESAESSGVEVDATLRPLNGLTLMGSYAYIDAKDTSQPDVETPLRRRPKHTGRLNVNYALPVGLNINLDVVFVGKRPDFIPGLNANGLLFLPSYTTADVTAAYAAGESLSLFGKLVNLTDANYQEVVGYPTAGRQFIGGAQVAF